MIGSWEGTTAIALDVVQIQPWIVRLHRANGQERSPQ
jgi:hypothetical protein